MKTTRKVYTSEEKQAIVQESFTPGQFASEVAKKHGITNGMLYSWRRRVQSAGKEPLATSIAKHLKHLPTGPTLGPVVSDPTKADLHQLKSRLEKLEHLLGKKLVEIELLKQS